MGGISDKSEKEYNRDTEFEDQGVPEETIYYTYKGKKMVHR